MSVDTKPRAGRYPSPYVPGDPLFPLRILVLGEPGPKGSFNVYQSKTGGRPQGRESSKRAKPWMVAVAAVCRDLEIPKPLEPPYAISVDYFVVTPKSPKFPWPGSLRVGDIDKLDRATYDGLKAGGLITDDAHIIRSGPNTKTYAGFGQNPYAVITISTANYLVPA